MIPTALFIDDCVNVWIWKSVWLSESDSEQGLMDEIHVQMNLLFWIYVFMMDVQ